MVTPQRYPLTWPAGWRRTPAAARRRAAFNRRTTTSVVIEGQSQDRTARRALTVADAIGRLAGELRRLDAGREILSTNVALRLDGQPRSDRQTPDDPGAAVYFRLDGRDQALACDRWDRTADNVAAIAEHIAALRAIDRYGVGTLEQAFRGYTALPPKADVDWWIPLELPATATLDQVEAQYRELAKRHHPDAGGHADDMARLTAARDRARVVLG